MVRMDKQLIYVGKLCYNKTLIQIKSIVVMHEHLLPTLGSSSLHVKVEEITVRTIFIFLAKPDFYYFIQ